jgi:hypothetical protein
MAGSYRHVSPRSSWLRALSSLSSAGQLLDGMAAQMSSRLCTQRLYLVLRQCKRSARSARHCKALTVCRVCKIAVLPGDGIGPEIAKVAVSTLQAAGELEGVDFRFTEAHIGGAAIDAAGSPLPEETLQVCRSSDAVLLAAIGGCGMCPSSYCSCRSSL